MLEILVRQVAEGTLGTATKAFGVEARLRASGAGANRGQNSARPPTAGSRQGCRMRKSETRGTRPVTACTTPGATSPVLLRKLNQGNRARRRQHQPRNLAELSEERPQLGSGC